MALVGVYLFTVMPAQPGGAGGAAMNWRGPAWCVVREAVYEPSSRVLRVRLASGVVYVSRGVRPECFAGFLRARAKGEFFEQCVRRRYETERMDP